MTGWNLMPNGASVRNAASRRFMPRKNACCKGYMYRSRPVNSAYRRMQRRASIRYALRIAFDAAVLVISLAAIAAALLIAGEG